MKIKDLKQYEEKVILGYEADGDQMYREKLVALGLTRGEKIKFIKKAPLGDPLQVEVRGFSVSLRKEEADILIIGDNFERTCKCRIKNCTKKEITHKKACNCDDKICEKNGYTIAIAGNPNCGKTTIFNALTGSKQKVGNWPGVTVEKLYGEFSYKNKDIKVVDLPGIYSFSAHSEDEKVSRDYLLSNEADLVINIIDSSNLDRNLYLTTQLIEMNIPVLLVFSMKDSVEAKNMKVDVDKLEAMLDLPSIYISATENSDITKLKDFIIDNVDCPKISGVEVRYDNEIEDVIEELSELVAPVVEKVGANSRWIVLKLLEGDEAIKEVIYKKTELSKEKLDSKIESVEKMLNDEMELILADTKYGFISGIVKSAVSFGLSKRQVTEKIDSIVLHRFFGIPIFLLMMYFVFWMAISFGGAFIDFFDILFGTIFVDGVAHFLSLVNAPDIIITILANGIGGGIQTLGTFIPIIFMLFFMTSLLEDSGYMSRAAFVVDRFMRLIGLPGKAFIPMILGFGCTVPAIMGTRTLENKRDRFLTIFMAPFMSCGARMPVYALFAAAFFSRNGQNIVFLIYGIGIVLAIITGLLLKKTLFKGESAPFVMELPVYHAPRIQHIFLHTWTRLKGFVVDAGRVLIVVIAVLGFLNSIGTDGSFNNEDSEQSVLSYMGKAVTPIFEPFGVEEENWQASVALFTGLFAKEVIVGTLNSLYFQEVETTEEDAGFSLMAGVKDAFTSIPTNILGLFDLGALSDPLAVNIDYSKDESGAVEELEVSESIFEVMRHKFSHGPLQAFAYLLFVLLYVPCLVAVAATYKEVGAKLTIFQATYTTTLAWVIATLFYQITIGHSVFWITTAIAIESAFIAGIVIYANRKTHTSV